MMVELEEQARRNSYERMRC
jgi:hypothetical protein